MKIVIAFQFEMQPRPGQTGRECLAAARGEVSDWVLGLFRGAGIHDLQLSFDGARASLRAGHEIRTDQQDCATHQLASVEWEFPEPRDPALLWQFSCVLASDAQAVQAALLIGARARSFALRPLNAALGNENPFSTIGVLRDKLLLGWSCRVAGQPVPTRARPLRKSHVDQFAREVLLNPKRVLPVVLLVLGGPLKVDADALQALQSHLLGLAQVAAVLDQPAAERLEKQVGPGLFPQGCGVRVCWPGLTREGSSLIHPYMTFEQLQQNLKAGPLDKQLIELLAPFSAEQFQEGSVIRAARAALAADRVERPRADPVAAGRRAAAVEAELQQARQAQQRLQQESEAARRHVQALLDDLAELRAQLAALRAAPPPEPARPEEKFDELAVELERAWDENKRLRADWEAGRRQLAELETDFRNYLDSSALLWETRDVASAPAPPLASAGSRSFTTVADAVRAAANEFADVLAVWEDAERSAEQSSFGSPAKVFQALEAIAEVGRAYFKARNGGPPLGPMDRAFLSRIPFKYTCFESPTTLSLFGAERVFHHGGQSRQMQRHLTLGGGTTNNCLQIYFEFDDPAQRVLIGYCGRHLPYSSQRT